MADAPSIPTYPLNDGVTLPAVGFGTYPLKGPDGVEAIVSALEGGYRLIDTAVNYENETEVGEALRRSGLPREQVQVTSKLPGRHHAHADAIASVRGSLDQLEQVMQRYAVDEVVLSSPAINGKVEQRIREVCAQLERPVRRLHMDIR